MTEQLDVLDPVTREHVERAAEALQREFRRGLLAGDDRRYIAELTA